MMISLYLSLICTFAPTKWQWDISSNPYEPYDPIWTDYYPLDSDAIEKGFQDGLGKVPLSIGSYHVDLAHMKQRSNDLQRNRRVRRVEVGHHPKSITGAFPSCGIFFDWDNTLADGDRPPMRENVKRELEKKLTSFIDFGCQMFVITAGMNPGGKANTIDEKILPRKNFFSLYDYDPNYSKLVNEYYRNENDTLHEQIAKKKVEILQKINQRHNFDLVYFLDDNKQNTDAMREAFLQMRVPGENSIHVVWDSSYRHLDNLKNRLKNLKEKHVAKERVANEGRERDLEYFELICGKHMPSASDERLRKCAEEMLNDFISSGQLPFRFTSLLNGEWLMTDPKSNDNFTYVWKAQSDIQANEGHNKFKFVGKQTHHNGDLLDEPFTVYGCVEKPAQKIMWIVNGVQCEGRINFDGTITDGTYQKSSDNLNVQSQNEFFGRKLSEENSSSRKNNNTNK